MNPETARTCRPVSNTGAILTASNDGGCNRWSEAQFHTALVKRLEQTDLNPLSAGYPREVHGANLAEILFAYECSDRAPLRVLAASQLLVGAA